MLRINDFYPAFNKCKEMIIEKLVLPCLSYTEEEGADFYEDPTEFVNHTLQVVERQLVITEAKMDEEIADEVKQHETLKTFAAQFLNTLCKYQDGTLSHLFEYAIGVITQKVVSIHYKSNMFIVLAILRQYLKDRKDLNLKMAQTIHNLLSTLPIPILEEGKTKDEDIEYAGLLMLLSKCILLLVEIYPVLF